ncbi:unnamed protein product, partial [Rangifer tarandus platyrhynchus]
MSLGRHTPAGGSRASPSEPTQHTGQCRRGDSGPKCSTACSAPRADARTRPTALSSVNVTCPSSRWPGSALILEPTSLDSEHARNPVGALVGAAVLKCHKRGGFDSSNGVSHGPGGHESEMEVSA